MKPLKLRHYGCKVSITEDNYQIININSDNDHVILFTDTALIPMEEYHNLNDRPKTTVLEMTVYQIIMWFAGFFGGVVGIKYWGWFE